jgi:hypothetical protein
MVSWPMRPPTRRFPLWSCGGRVDTTGAWLVGAKGEYPLRVPYLLRDGTYAADLLIVAIAENRSHELRGHPLHSVGELGIVCEIAVDQLSRVRPPERTATQAAWLEQHGIGELVDKARAVWTERAHVGDLVALRARSRVLEAEALLDPGGLGGCRVLEWAG